MEAQKKRESMKIVPPGKKKCVWMEAGVVSYKLCDNNYDCPTCVYDQGMQLKVAKQSQAAADVQVDAPDEKFTGTWVDKMMKLPASQRKCRYMITGEVGRKICPNSYECGNCDFDKMMQARLRTETLPVHGISEVAGFKLAADTYYHDGHTWAKPEYGGRVRVGLDDFGAKLLGQLKSIELPDIGHELKQGEEGFLVKRNGDTAKVLSPLDGVIAHVNKDIFENPSLINESPYENGWLFIIEPSKLRKNLKSLHYGDDAKDFIGKERDQLFNMAHGEMRLAADGGASVDDLTKDLKGKEWTKFVSVFLRT